MAQPLEGFGPPEVEGFGPAEQPKQAPGSQTSIAGATMAHGANALVGGAGPWIQALSATLGHLPFHLAVSAAPQLLGKWGISPEDQKPILQQFSDYKHGIENYLAQSQKEHPFGAGVGAGVGGGLSAVLMGGAGAAEQAATKVPSFYESIINAMRGGAAYGTVSGAATSKADLTKPGGASQLMHDELRGFGEGGVIGGTAAGASKPIMAAAEKLQEVGRSQLFRTAMGHSKATVGRLADKSMMALSPGELDRAGPYLDELGITHGDTTGTIADKLNTRVASVGDSIGGMMKSLDEHGIQISPADVAERIKASAAPLYTAAQRDAYNKVLTEAEELMKHSQKKYGGRPLTLAEAWEERRGAQNEANWGKEGQDASHSEVMKTVGRAWNDVIDSKAEPLLQQSGQSADAYRKLRDEYSLIKELQSGVRENLKSQAAKSHPIGGLMDIAAAGAAGAATHGNPYATVAAGVLNYAARAAVRNFGGAIAGRGALQMSRLAPEAPQIPDFLRGAALSPLAQPNEDEKR